MREPSGAQRIVQTFTSTFRGSINPEKHDVEGQFVSYLEPQSSLVVSHATAKPLASDTYPQSAPGSLVSGELGSSPTARAAQAPLTEGLHGGIRL